MNSIRRISCGIVNCYLLTGDAGNILIDSGNPGDGEKIVSALNGTPISLILLTH